VSVGAFQLDIFCGIEGWLTRGDDVMSEVRRGADVEKASNSASLEYRAYGKKGMQIHASELF
jgi:hypothetical protein